MSQCNKRNRSNLIVFTLIHQSTKIFHSITHFRRSACDLPTQKTKLSHSRTGSLLRWSHLIPVVRMKMTHFWDGAPCSHAEIGWRFRGPRCLHRQGEHPRKQPLSYSSSRKPEISFRFRVVSLSYWPLETVQNCFAPHPSVLAFLFPSPQ
jgi:hypothetical protein